MLGIQAGRPHWLPGAAYALMALAGCAAPAHEHAAADGSEVAVFDDFEATVPVAIDPNGILTGFVVFDDGPSSVEFTITGEHPPVPGAADDNHVLRIDVEVTEWVVFAHFFAYEDGAGGLWMPYDWRAYDGVSFWLFGQDSGVELFVDIIDNRNPRSITDDAERFVYTFKDDFAGWKRISIPFEDFVRKDIGNGAPDDGLGRDRVNGWAIGTTFSDGPRTYYIDDFALQPAATDDHDHLTDSMAHCNDGQWLDPENRRALRRIAGACVERGQYDEAERLYRMAIEAGPEDARLERDYRLTLRQLEMMRPTRGASWGD